MLKRSNLFDNISRYLLAATLIIVPLFPKFPLLRITGSYVAIRFEDILLLLLGIFIFIKVIPRLKVFFADEIFRAFLIFFFIGLVSTISAAFVTHTIDLKIGILHLLRRAEYIIPFLGVLLLLKGEDVGKNLNFFIKLLFIVTIVAFVYGWGQRYFNLPIIITQNEEYSKGVALFWTPGSHINSTFAGHYDLAAVMVLFLPVFITGLFLIKDNISRLFLFVSTAAGFWLLINSVSRIAQFSYIVAVAVSLLLARKFKALGITLLISFAIILTSSNLLARFGRIFEVIYRQVETKLIVSAADIVLPEKRPDAPATTVPEVQIFEDRSTSIRLNVEWPRALRAFSKNFLLGTGYSSIELATDNDYLRLLGETGILGFFSFWLIFIRIGKSLKDLVTKKLPPLERTFGYAVIGGLLGTFVTAFFIDVFEASKFAIIFWFLIGMGVYISRNTKYLNVK
jgi:hypothetical protein